MYVYVYYVHYVWLVWHHMQYWVYKSENTTSKLNKLLNVAVIKTEKSGIEALP